MYQILWHTCAWHPQMQYPPSQASMIMHSPTLPYSGKFWGGANFQYFHDYPTSHKIFHSQNFQSVIAHALHNVENTNVLNLKGRNSYKNDSLLLSALCQECRHRSLTITIHPSLHADWSQQGGEESWGTIEEVRHVPDGYCGGKGEGGNVRKCHWGLCYRQVLQ